MTRLGSLEFKRLKFRSPLLLEVNGAKLAAIFHVNKLEVRANEAKL